MKTETLSGAKRRLLDYLKRTGPSTVASIAVALDLTTVAVRQHLLGLEENGLAFQEKLPPKGRGRPSTLWKLTPLAAEVFPDHHADLTVDLIEAARQAFGPEGLRKLIDVRSRGQVEAYAKIVPGPRASLKKRVEALATQRTAEGYMAEAVQEKPGQYLLIEHHCPICDAAKSCTGLCSAELEVFRRALGENVRVERVQHLLSDSDRCAYRIEKTNPI